MVSIVYDRGDRLILNEFKGRVEAFAGHLRLALDLRGMKKADLSRQTGISEQRIGQYVRGSYEARHSALRAIAETLRVNPAWLAGYDAPMEPSVDKRVVNAGKIIAGDDLKLTVFGTKDVSDALLEDVMDMAKIHLELWKKKQGGLQKAKIPHRTIRV